MCPDDGYVEERKKCQNCLDGVMHSVCIDDNGWVEEPKKLWKDDEEDLTKRVDELEARIEEMWERMKQYEAVITTAFRLAPIGELKRYDRT